MSTSALIETTDDQLLPGLKVRGKGNQDKMKWNRSAMLFCVSTLTMTNCSDSFQQLAVNVNHQLLFLSAFFCLFLRTSSTGGGGGGGGGNVTNTMTNAFFIVFQFFRICICRRHLSQQCCHHHHHHQWRPSRSRKRKKVLTLSPLLFWLMFIVITAPFNFSIFETNTHTQFCPVLLPLFLLIDGNTEKTVCVCVSLDSGEQWSGHHTDRQRFHLSKI